MALRLSAMTMIVTIVIAIAKESLNKARFSRRKSDMVDPLWPDWQI
jgi:hypothetical protein